MIEIATDLCYNATGCIEAVGLKMTSFKLP